MTKQLLDIDSLKKELTAWRNNRIRGNERIPDHFMDQIILAVKQSDYTVVQRETGVGKHQIEKYIKRRNLPKKIMFKEISTPLDSTKTGVIRQEGPSFSQISIPIKESSLIAEIDNPNGYRLKLYSSSKESHYIIQSFCYPNINGGTQ